MKVFNLHLSHKVRNILILSILLIFVLSIGGYRVFYLYPKELDKLDTQINEKQKQIEELEFVGVQLEEILKKIEKEELKLASLDKQIVTEVSPSQSYHYLNTILNYSGFLDFDMIFTGTKKKNQYFENTYSVKGEGSFQSIYNFISFIEKGPELYKARKLRLRGVEAINVEDEQYEFVVTFDMELAALYAKIDNLPPVYRSLNDVRFSKLRNPLYPIIKKDLPPNFYELLEAERAELKAVMPNKAFVKDHKRMTHILEEGDEVYLGYVKSIDEANSRVVFTLDKGGIVEEFVLELRFQTEEEK